MIAKNLKSRSFAGCVDYVMRVNHDHNIYTSDTWRIIGSQGIIGETREQIIASMEAGASLESESEVSCRTHLGEFSFRRQRQADR